MARGEYRTLDANKELQWDDILLTIIVLFSACQDTAFGVWRFGWPGHFLEYIHHVKLLSIDDDTTRLTRVGSFGQLESGAGSFLLAAYRVMRWYKHRPFNGINYQLAFMLNAIGKTGAFIMNEQVLGWATFGQTDGMPLDRYFLLLRAGLADVAFVMSLWTYRSSWEWVWKS